MCLVGVEGLIGNLQTVCSKTAETQLESKHSVYSSLWPITDCRLDKALHITATFTVQSSSHIPIVPLVETGSPVKVVLGWKTHLPVGPLGPLGTEINAVEGGGIPSLLCI